MTDDPDQNGRASPPPRPRTRRARTVSLAGLAAVVGLAAGIGAVYVSGGFSDNSGGACPGAAARIAAIEPAIGGAVAALQPLDRPIPLGALGFNDAAGTPRTLADFAGETVLFNLWATWCAPCRVEMPTLAALQTDLGGPDFEVVAVSVDTRSGPRLKGFLEETGATALAFHHEPTMTLFNTLKDAGLALGMPTTLLIDEDGCALAVLHGPAEWNAPEAKSVIQAAIES